MFHDPEHDHHSVASPHTSMTSSYPSASEVPSPPTIWLIRYKGTIRPAQPSLLGGWHAGPKIFLFHRKPHVVAPSSEASLFFPSNVTFAPPAARPPVTALLPGSSFALFRNYVTGSCAQGPNRFGIVKQLPVHVPPNPKRTGEGGKRHGVADRGCGPSGAFQMLLASFGSPFRQTESVHRRVTSSCEQRRFWGEVTSLLPPAFLPRNRARDPVTFTTVSFPQSSSRGLFAASLRVCKSEKALTVPQSTIPFDATRLRC